MKNLLCIAFIIGLLVLSPDVAAQSKKKRNKMYPAYSTSRPNQQDDFLKTQWWLGFRAGMNMTEAVPTTTYSGFSPINYNPDDKEYSSYELPGGHAGLEITFYHNGFSFSLQPNYRRQRFSYSNEFTWFDTENADNQLDLKYDQDHQLDYIDIPLLIKYDITQGKLRPFIQIGGYYATLSDANKAVEISGTDYASGGAGPFNTENLVIGAESLFIKSSLGLIGGAGASYDFWNMRLVADITYRHGMHNIVNVKNRYSENELAGIGDALDDLEVRNISFSLGFLFPLRFINKQFDAN